MGRVPVPSRPPEVYRIQDVLPNVGHTARRRRLPTGRRRADGLRLQVCRRAEPEERAQQQRATPHDGERHRGRPLLAGGEPREAEAHALALTLAAAANPAPGISAGGSSTIQLRPKAEFAEPGNLRNHSANTETHQYVCSNSFGATRAPKPYIWCMRVHMHVRERERGEGGKESKREREGDSKPGGALPASSLG